MALVTKDRPGGVSQIKKKEPLVLTLPAEANVPPAKLTESIIVIYGRKGIGKTSLASQFDGSLTFMFEKGRRNLPIRQIPVKDEEKLDWERFIGYVDLCLADDTVQTIVVDTLDRAYEKCMDYVCARAGCTHPNDMNDYGKTWNAVKNELARVLCKIQDSGKGLILLSHEGPKPLAKKIKGLKREGDGSSFQYERMEPTCAKGAFETIQEICDYVFYYSFREEYRTITVRSPDDTAWTSCGIGDRFLDPDGDPVNCFVVGSNPRLAYENLVQAHANQLRDIDYIPPKGK